MIIHSWVVILPLFHPDSKNVWTIIAIDWCRVGLPPTSKLNAAQYPTALTFWMIGSSPTKSKQRILDRWAQGLHFWGFWICTNPASSHHQSVSKPWGEALGGTVDLMGSVCFKFKQPLALTVKWILILGGFPNIKLWVAEPQGLKVGFLHLSSLELL